MTPFRIFLLLEGSEEEWFFKAVIEAKIVNPVFEIILKNVGGYGNLAPYFHGAFNNDEYDCTMCVYDVDNRHREEESPFCQVQANLLEVLGSQEAVDAISLCTNPNILQMFLLCCDSLERVAITTSSKRENSSLVTRYWPEIGKAKRTKNGETATALYDAQTWQLRMMKDSLCFDRQRSLQLIFANGIQLPLDYRSAPPGGNLLPFLQALRDGDIDYFQKIRRIVNLESDDNNK